MSKKVTETKTQKEVRTEPETQPVKRGRGRPRKDSVDAKGPDGNTRIYKVNAGNFLLGLGIEGRSIYAKHDRSLVITVLNVDGEAAILMEKEDEMSFFTHSATLRRSMKTLISNLDKLGLSMEEEEEEDDEE